MLFYRFISENLSTYINAKEIEAGVSGFDYAKASDEDAEYSRNNIVEEKGFFIKPSDLFENVYKKARGDFDLNETLRDVFKRIEQSAVGSKSESSMKGLLLI